MAHLSLQLGAALVVPFAAPRRVAKSGRNWRLRALREAAAVASRGGSRGPSGGLRRRVVPASAPTRRRILAETAGE